MTDLRIPSKFTTIEKMKILTITIIADDCTNYSNNNSSIFLNIIEQKIVRLELINILVAKINILYYAAAATTAIAGILHLIQAQNVLEFSLNFFIFFLVAGITQLFWVVPMIKKWGLPWYYVGIGGTIVLIILFAITRMPNNPITGRGGPVSPMALAIEVFQVAFIGLSIAIIVYEIKSKKQLSGKTAPETL